MTSNPSAGVVPRLSIMMFLQFFVWGAWFATLSAAMDANGLGDFKGGAYDSAPIAAVFAPLFLGLIADRLFPSERVMGLLMLIGGALLAAIPTVAEKGAEGGDLMVWLILGHLLCYMPTLGLGNTIAFTHITNSQDFPKVRVWGTIGWIAAGLMVGFAGWSNQFEIFYAGAISAILLGLYCFSLPSTPPPLKGQPIDARSLLMVDAFSLLKDFNFLVFAVCSTLICVPLAYYYGVTSTYLNQVGYVDSASTMTIGQMSEIIFMLMIPFFFRKLGLKMMIMVGMGCWVLRYLLFAWAAPDQTAWMLLLAIALHGVCYDFFFVTGFMYTDQKAPKAVRGQAQSLLVFLTQGVGMFFGYKIAFGGEFAGQSLAFTVDGGEGVEYGKQVDSAAYLDALGAAREARKLSFSESMQAMVDRSLPDSLDPALLQETMNQWANFWVLPAIMAGAILGVFAIAFWDKASTDDENMAADDSAA